MSKTALFKRTAVLLGIAFVLSGPTASQNRRRSDIDSTASILISQYMIRTGSEALLITDPEQVQELVHLFRNNSTVPHACAYHWILWFRQSATISIPFAHNEECEVYAHHNKRIHKLLNSYFSSILKTPRDFIVTLTVPASMSPQELAQKLENNGRQIFFLDRSENRLPRLRLEATSVSPAPKSRRDWPALEKRNLQQAETALERALQVIKANYPVVNSTPADHRSSSSVGERFEDKVESTIYFASGTDLNNIVIAPSVHIIEKVVPSSYMVQLVVKEPFSERLRSLLISENAFVVDVRAFGNFH